MKKVLMYKLDPMVATAAYGHAMASGSYIEEAHWVKKLPLDLEGVESIYTTSGEYEVMEESPNVVIFVMTPGAIGHIKVKKKVGDDTLVMHVENGFFVKEGVRDSADLMASLNSGGDMAGSGYMNTPSDFMSSEVMRVTLALFEHMAELYITDELPATMVAKVIAALGERYDHDREAAIEIGWTLAIQRVKNSYMSGVADVVDEEKLIASLIFGNSGKYFESKYDWDDLAVEVYVRNLIEVMTG